MRIRIVRIPPIADIDGVSVDCFQVGAEYDVGNTVGSLFLAEGWAEPVDLDAPRPPQAFSADDPFGVMTLDRNSPPNLVKEHQPPFVERDVAADFRWRRRRRDR
jgi:hypothetical protein